MRAVAFSALFAVFRDALAVIVACWHARVCSGGWDGVVGWGGANNVLVALHTYVRSRVFAHIGNATL